MKALLGTNKGLVKAVVAAKTIADKQFADPIESQSTLTWRSA